MFRERIQPRNVLGSFCRFLRTIIEFPQDHATKKYFVGIAKLM
jgi:hypothetical protein